MGKRLKAFLNFGIQDALAAESHPQLPINGTWLSCRGSWIVGRTPGWQSWSRSVNLLIGIALILGLFTAVAAFFSGFMVWNFALAGTAGVAPMFLILSVLLVAAWRIAGLWGLDRFRFEYIGTAWQPGKWFTKKK